MSAEPKRITKSEVWTEWESQVVNGIFPLRRFLGGTNHSAVFLTEYKAANLADAAIKFVPADAAQTDLVQWGAAATLTHPHLIRIFDAGRCQIRGRGFLFVVMEYAEQTLAEVLAKRALSPGEVREMLVPTLDALAFLHRNHLVHGRLKPSNILVVNDQLKLASDTIRPTGNSTSGVGRTSAYDPPELKHGVIATPADVWGLGMTLVEALTQRAPAWPEERSETASLVANFPAPLGETARRCLNPTPANRPTVLELETQYKSAPRARAPAATPQPPRPAPRAANPPRRSANGYLLLVAIAAVLVIAFVWMGSHSSSPSQAPLEPPAVPVAAVPEPGASAAAEPAELPPEVATPVSPSPVQSSPPAATSPAVLHQVIPDVPPAAGNRIRSSIKVTVRVLVDPTGEVVGQLLESPGASRYFARLAGDAAAEWKFAPADTRDSRVWLLRFEFTRDGATVQATAAQ